MLQLRLLDLGDHPGDFLRLAPEPPALEAGRLEVSKHPLAGMEDAGILDELLHDDAPPNNQSRPPKLTVEIHARSAAEA